MTNIHCDKYYFYIYIFFGSDLELEKKMLMSKKCKEKGLYTKKYFLLFP